MLLVILKWDINNISQVIMRTLLRVMSYILNLLFYIPIPPMVLTCTATQYPTTITSVLGIWATNCLLPPTDVELMVGHRRTREVDDSQQPRPFPDQNPIITHYMLSAWWLRLLDGLGNHSIRPGAI